MADPKSTELVPIHKNTTIRDEKGAVQEVPQAKYVFKNTPIKFVIKSNFFVVLEELRETQPNAPQIPLNHIETQILATAFKCITEANEARYSYDADTVFEIKLDDFCNIWGLPKSAKKSGLVYHNIINALERLQKRVFRYYIPSENKIVLSSYFAYITYTNQVISFGFPKPFIPYLQEMNKFTWYYFENILKLMDSNSTSLKSYAVIIYENIQKNKNMAFNEENGRHEIEFEIDQLQKLLSSNYPRKYDFITRVLDKSIQYTKKQLKMDITGKVIEKNGKATNYVISCVLPNEDLDFKAAIQSKSDQQPILSKFQINKFAKLLAYDDEFYGTFAKTGEFNDDLKKRLVKELSQIKKLEKYYPYLLKMGCLSQKLNHHMQKKINNIPNHEK